MKKLIILFFLSFSFFSLYCQWDNSKFNTVKYPSVEETIQDIDFHVYPDSLIVLTALKLDDFNFFTPEETVNAWFTLTELNSIEKLFYFKKDIVSPELESLQSRIDTYPNKRLSYKLISKFGFDYFDVPTVFINIFFHYDKVRVGHNRLLCLQQYDNKWFLVSFQNMNGYHDWIYKAFHFMRPDTFKLLLAGTEIPDHPILNDMIKKTRTESGVFKLDTFINEMANHIRNKNINIVETFFDIYVEKEYQGEKALDRKIFQYQGAFFSYPLNK